MTRRLSFAQATAQFTNRFTAEHVPAWARQQNPGNGKFYAPQFASDREWYENTLFHGETVALEDFETSTQADDHCRAACLAFFEGNREALEQYARLREGRTGGTATVWEHAGHDFALTRNRHGVGYWDRGLPQDLADRLTDAANDAGECWPYVGDDGQVYIH